MIISLPQNHKKTIAKGTTTKASIIPIANSNPNNMAHILLQLCGGPQDGRKSEHYMKKICLILCLMFCGSLAARAQCSPFQGLGAAQFFDNSGVVLTNGVLYSFQAGTSTQQATFTDSTCTTTNVNPITFTTGARVNIWLTTGNFYKFQLCLQNDGSTCAPSDVLFSVDNVPGGVTGGGGGGSGPPFISGSPNPATTGILRCASGDQCLVFRNAANSANLAISKDVNDVLSWAGGALKFPETICSASSASFDYWCADSPTHRWKFTVNGSGQLVAVGISAAAAAGNAPKFAANGFDLVDSGIAFSQLQNYEQIIAFANGGVPFSGGSSTACNASPNASPCQYYTFANNHVAQRLTVATSAGAGGCTQNAIVGLKDLTSGTTLLSVTNPPLGMTVVTGSATITAGDTIGLGLLQISTGCGAGVQVVTISVNYQ